MSLFSVFAEEHMSYFPPLPVEQVHAELIQQYYTSLIRSHGEYAQSAQPPASPFTAFPLPDPEEGIFADLEVELKHHAGNGDARTDQAGKDPLMKRVDGLVDGAEDDAMDGSHQARLVSAAAAASGMDVDGDATLATSTHVGGSGTSTSSPRIQQAESHKQMINSSSPHSSDTASSSLIATSSGSVFAAGMDGLSTSRGSHHQKSPRERRLHPPSISNDLISSSSSRSTSAYSSPQTQAIDSGSTPSTSLKSTYTANVPSRTSGARRLSKSAVPFPMTMTSTPASPRVDRTSAGAEDIVVGGGEDGDGTQDVQSLAGDENGEGQEQMLQGSVITARPSPAHRKISIVHEQAMADVAQRESELREAGLETDEMTGREARFRENERQRGRRASSPAISTQTNMNSAREHRKPESKISASSASTISRVPSSTLRASMDSPLPHHQLQSMTVSQPQRFKRFVGSLFRSKSVSSDLGGDSGIISSATILEHGRVTSNSSVSTLNDLTSPRRARSMLPPSVPPDAKVKHDHSPAVILSQSPRDMSTHTSAHPGSVTPRIRTRCERSTSPTTRTSQESTMDTGMDAESTLGSRSRFSHSPKRSRTSGDTRDGSSSFSSETGSATSHSSVPDDTDRSAGNATSKANQNGGNVSAIDWKCRSASSAGFDGVVDGLGVG
ncbi:hypothetical protein QFC24_004464 [Naganishia onofrii]|uniref:Uncharacterized protein n=1 Tax=Naganishia onofrii TaxID=1851511 RepID=A0ACC2XD79_9TREE|nr:hypothetical protein QFC24_004464 [Naganishia onofrii]